MYYRNEYILVFIIEEGNYTVEKNPGINLTIYVYKFFVA